MNRAERRAAGQRGARMPSGPVARLEVPERELVARFGPNVKDGDLVTMARVARRGGRIVTNCKPGHETPFRIKVIPT